MLRMFNEGNVEHAVVQAIISNRKLGEILRNDQQYCWRNDLCNKNSVICHEVCKSYFAPRH